MTWNVSNWLLASNFFVCLYVMFKDTLIRAWKVCSSYCTTQNSEGVKNLHQKVFVNDKYYRKHSNMYINNTIMLVSGQVATPGVRMNTPFAT